MKNDGVILGRRPTDYVHGLVGALPYEVRNQLGDWTPWLPSAERQSNRNTDTMACVSYSLLNVIETQIKFLTGKELNFSDRWLAKISGTTQAGNYLWAVADAVRLKGLVEQEVWPEPTDYTWDSYYAEIPLNIQSKGLEFLKNWTINYEWIEVSKDSLLKHLKHAPVQIVLPGHAIMDFYNEADVIHYFDTYDPFQKQTTVGNISDALKVIVTPKVMSNAVFVHKAGTQEYGFFLPATTPESAKDKALNLGLNIFKPDGTVDFASAKDVSGL